MAKFIVTIDGEQKEIDAENVQLPEGYATPDDVANNYVTKDSVNNLIQQRLDRNTKSTREKLLGDNDFQLQVLKKRGVPLDDKGNPKVKDIDIDQIKNNIISEQVEPLKNQLNQIRTQSLKSQLLNAAREANVDDKLLKKVNGSDPLIVNAFKDRFKFDEETGQFGLTDAQGNFKYKGGDASADNPYAGPGELFSELKKSDEYVDWFKDERQRGSGFGGNGSGAKQKFSEDEIQNMSDEEYAKNREKILGGAVN